MEDRQKRVVDGWVGRRRSIYGCWSTGEVGITAAGMSVAEREEVENAHKARREEEKKRTLLISQNCEAKTARKQAHRGHKLSGLLLCHVSDVCDISGKL